MKTIEKYLHLCENYNLKGSNTFLGLTVEISLVSNFK